MLRRKPPAPPALQCDPAAPDAFMWVMAALIYPRSRRRQEEAVASWHLDAAGHARDVAPRVAQMGREAAEAGFLKDLGLPPDAAAFAPWTAAQTARMANPEDAYRAAIDGWRRVPAPEKAAADSPGTAALLRDIQRTIDGGAYLAGAQLVNVARLAAHHPETGASLGRAQAVLTAHQRADGARVYDTRSLKRAWKDQKVVAPLTAAMLCLAERLSARMPERSRAAAGMEALAHPDGPRLMIGLAAWFRDFGMRHVPPGAREPILDADCVALPAETAPIDPELPPLDAETLAEALSPSERPGGRYQWNPLDRNW